LRGIVLDVDGTLLDPGHRIAPATAAAVQRARSAGLHVLLASGRSARSMLDVLAELGLDGPAIAFNGALTFRLERGAMRVLAETPLPRARATTRHSCGAPEPKRKGQVYARERARRYVMNRPIPSLTGKTGVDGGIGVVTPIPHPRRSCPSVKGLVALGTVERRREQDDLSLGTAP
jgi:hypothetical protein